MKESNAKKLLIGMPGHGKYFGRGGFVDNNYNDKREPFGEDKIRAYFGKST